MATLPLLDFVSRSLGLKLFPVQRVILKAFFGVSLDDTTRAVLVSNWDRTESKGFTEADYLKFCFDTGRSSIASVTKGESYRQMTLALGRRSGKDLLAQVLIASEALGSPEGRIISLSASKETAFHLKERVRVSLNETSQPRVDFLTSQAPIRGGESLLLYSDMAHFLEEAASLKKLQSRLSERPTPSETDPKVVALSSPLARRGLFYDMFQVGFQTEGSFSFQAPSWEVNPTIPIGFLREEEARDPGIFRASYGAEFLR